jgi:D-tyrosyl-tRNA(Tyr) deacylase
VKLLLQRVLAASVDIDGDRVGEIGPGLMVLMGVESHDDELSMRKAIDKLLAYRVFGDADGKMNLSLNDTQGGLLLVSQFTLAANTRKGLRPSFSSAAVPEQAKDLYQKAITYAATKLPQVACGRFAADMQVSLVNDGPVTFLLEF